MVVLLNIFVETILFEIEILYRIINVFTVTFDQFNVSLLNKRINWKIYINLTDPKLDHIDLCDNMPHSIGVSGNLTLNSLL